MSAVAKCRIVVISNVPPIVHTSPSNGEIIFNDLLSNGETPAGLSIRTPIYGLGFTINGKSFHSVIVV